MNAVLVLNHDAASLNGARGAVDEADLRAAFTGHGIAARVLHAEPRELPAAIEAAKADRPETIFVGGGDGTISTAANSLAGSGVPLGVLPLGTLNHFARDLSLPADWQEAVAALAHGERRSVDVGEVNGRVFINNCSLGSYAEAVRKRDALRRERGTGKWWAMAMASFSVFRRLRRLRIRIDAAGQTRALRTPLVVVANNRYSGQVLDYSLRPRMDEGRLWIYTTRVHRRLALLRLMWQAVFHEIDSATGLEQFSAAEAEITSKRLPLPIAVDGELADLRPPLRFRIRPRALDVLAPAAAKNLRPETAIAAAIPPS